jgi:hypothetical protein
MYLAGMWADIACIEQRWQQVLTEVATGTDRQSHLKTAQADIPETTCGSFLVLYFDIGGFGSPVSTIQSDSTINVTVAYDTDQRPEIVLPCVSAIFLNFSKNCDLGKIFNLRWCKKGMKRLHSMEFYYLFSSPNITGEKYGG